MKFTQEHEELRRTTRAFIEKEINPYVDLWEHEGIFPAHEIFKKLGDAGLLGISKPEEDGGMGLDLSYDMVFAEELGNIECGGVSMAIGVQTHMATPSLASYGTPELKEKYLKPALRGEQVVSIAVSEVAGGSDVAALKTTAVKDGDDYVINGSKMWITNATQADWMCLLANTSEENGPHLNKSQIIVPTDTPGITMSPRLNKLGMRSSDTAQIFFDNVRVPQSNLIGKEGFGFAQQMQQFQMERMYTLCSVRSMDNIIDETVNYCRERETFGQPLINNQAIHFRLAELKTEVELLRSLFYRACEEALEGKDITLLASMAKLKSGRLTREVSDTCLQYFGGQGFMWDNRISRYYRDARLGSIGGGADEIMLGVICKFMNTLPAPKK